MMFRQQRFKWFCSNKNSEEVQQSVANYHGAFVQLAFQQHEPIQHLLFHHNLLLAVQTQHLTLARHLPHKRLPRPIIRIRCIKRFWWE